MQFQLSHYTRTAVNYIGTYNCQYIAMNWFISFIDDIYQKINFDITLLIRYIKNKKTHILRNSLNVIKPM